MAPGIKAAPGTSGVEFHVPQPVTYQLQLVDTASGDPLRDARVGLLEGMDIESERTLDVTSTAPGSYSLRVLLPEASEGTALLASKPGYQTIALGGIRFVPGGIQDIGVVPLAQLPLTTVRVVSRAGAAPIAGASVSAAPPPSNDYDCYYDHVRSRWPARSELHTSWKGRTDEDGTVRVPLASGEPYRIRVDHPDFGSSERMLAGGSSSGRFDIELLRGGTISARVLDARDGSPVAGEEIECQYLDERNDWSSCGRLRSDSDGRVCFAHLAPGLHRLWPSCVDEERARLVDLRNEATVEVELASEPEEVVRLSGRVTDHGAPVPGATVESYGGETATDLEGRYVLEDEEPGEQVLSVTHPHFGLVFRREVELLSPETRVDIELDLVPVRGLVLDAERKPLRGVLVYLAAREDGRLDAQSPEQDAMHCMRTLADGGFEFGGVQAIEGLLLVARMDGYRIELAGPLVFPEDRSAVQHTFVLRPALELDVLVENADEVSLTFASVVAIWVGEGELDPEEREQTARDLTLAHSGSGGRYHFGRLIPGRWRIEVRSILEPEHPLLTTSVELEEGRGRGPIVLRR